MAGSSRGPAIVVYGDDMTILWQILFLIAVCVLIRMIAGAYWFDDSDY